MALYDPADPAFSSEAVERYRRLRHDHPLYRDPDRRARER